MASTHFFLRSTRRSSDCARPRQDVLRACGWLIVTTILACSAAYVPLMVETRYDPTVAIIFLQC